MRKDSPHIGASGPARMEGRSMSSNPVISIVRLQLRTRTLVCTEVRSMDGLFRSRKLMIPGKFAPLQTMLSTNDNVKHDQRGFLTFQNDNYMLAKESSRSNPATEWTGGIMPQPHRQRESREFVKKQCVRGLRSYLHPPSTLAAGTTSTTAIQRVVVAVVEERESMAKRTDTADKESCRLFPATYTCVS